MGSHISGSVRDLDTGRGITGVRVRVMDKDIFRDDCLGECSTDDQGGFRLPYTQEASRDLLPDRPDVYVVVEGPEGKVLGTTSDETRLDVQGDVEVNIHIPHARLVEVGLADRQPAKWMEDLDAEELKPFTSWTWRDGESSSDEAATLLRTELADKSSVLELMKSYIDDLKGSADNNAEPFQKLGKLFELGLTPDAVEGHFYGVPVGMRTLDQVGPAAEYGNVLGFLWGTTLANDCPWVGKSLSPMTDATHLALTGKAIGHSSRAFSGINHFNRIDLRPLSFASFHLLTWWMGLKPAPEAETATFGHERNGGNFIGSRASSVYPNSKRDVFQLNYRWPTLDNPPPLRWLIDELVQVADGLYLGQLLFATKRLLRDYDPEHPSEDYRYQHFGYFVLFDERWNAEAQRLLPHLEVPAVAPGLIRPGQASQDPGKFTFLMSEAPPPGTGDDAVMSEVRKDLQRMPTIMHLMKHYSDELQGGLDNDSPLFLRLQELFVRGAGIPLLEGRFRGALVSWHSDGLTNLLDLNTLNLAWMRVGATFSTWTGKTFEPISKEKLAEITDGFETDERRTVWGANTQALRTFRERFVGRLMKLAKVWSEEVSPEEARRFGYDLKNFFFVAHQADSVDPQTPGKKVFQFNYRWPKLRSIVPDRYCLDELVQIAEGLYLGKLMYATNVLKEYDPSVDPKEYRYGHFGYFLLMDDAWHRVRLDIGFDMENV